MKILKTQFKDLLIIKNKKFQDNRGSFRELLVEKNIKKRFPFNVVSISKKNVIRGLHYQKKNAQGKFISVIKGRILGLTIKDMILGSFIRKKTVNVFKTCKKR